MSQGKEQLHWVTDRVPNVYSHPQLFRLPEFGVEFDKNRTKLDIPQSYNCYTNPKDFLFPEFGREFDKDIPKIKVQWATKNHETLDEAKARLYKPYVKVAGGKDLADKRRKVIPVVAAADGTSSTSAATTPLATTTTTPTSTTVPAAPDAAPTTSCSTTIISADVTLNLLLLLKE